MKNILLAIFIIALVVLFGTWPLSILAKVLEFLTMLIDWLAKALNVFGWNGLI